MKKKRVLKRGKKVRQWVTHKFTFASRQKRVNFRHRHTLYLIFQPGRAGTPPLVLFVVKEVLLTLPPTKVMLKSQFLLAVGMVTSWTVWTTSLAVFLWRWTNDEIFSWMDESESIVMRGRVLNMLRGKEECRKKEMEECECQKKR